MVRSFSLSQPRSGIGAPSKSETVLFSTSVGKVRENVDVGDQTPSVALASAPSAPAVSDPLRVDTGNVLRAYTSVGVVDAEVLEEPELPAKNLTAEEKEDILAVCKTLRLCLPRIFFKASFLKRCGQ